MTARVRHTVLRSTCKHCGLPIARIDHPGVDWRHMRAHKGVERFGAAQCRPTRATPSEEETP